MQSQVYKWIAQNNTKVTLWSSTVEPKTSMQLIVSGQKTGIKIKIQAKLLQPEVQWRQKQSSPSINLSIYKQERIKHII